MLVERGDEDQEQLPWQLIAILSGEMLDKLRRHWSWYEYDCRAARSGAGLPQIEAAPHASKERTPPHHLVEQLKALSSVMEAGYYSLYFSCFTIFFVEKARFK